MNPDQILALIAKHGTVTAEPLRDLIVTVVLEAVEQEREKIEKLKAELDKLDSRCTELLFEIKMIHGA
jgi:hypothetical protein